jgi:hypothetical protein
MSLAGLDFYGLPVYMEVNYSPVVILSTRIKGSDNFLYLATITRGKSV